VKYTFAQSGVAAPAPKRRFTGLHIAVTALSLAAAILVIAGLALRQAAKRDAYSLRVKDSVEVEYGRALPAGADFLRNNVTGKIPEPLIENLAALSSEVPGEFPVTLNIGGVRCYSLLNVIDRTEPVVTAKSVTAIWGENLVPRDFVADAYDIGKITYHFAQIPDVHKIGEQIVRLEATDDSGNTASVQARLYILSGTLTVVKAIGEAEDITIDDFVFKLPEGHTAVLRTAIHPEYFQSPGERPVKLLIDGRGSDALLVIRDVLPPEAHALDVKGWIGEALPPDAFYDELTDSSEVSARFVSEPDWYSEEKQSVRIILTDAAGNSTELTASLVLGRDTEAPRIEARNQTVLLGDKIAYRSGAAVTDNKDENLTLEIDSSAVDVQTAGRYPVIYSATDSAGNTASVTAYIYVGEVTSDFVYELADEIIENLGLDGLTDREKVQKIWNYVRSNVGYVNEGEHDNVAAGAYAAFSTRRGDCFTYYAAVEVLLTRAGVPNEGVRRSGGRSNHFWSLVELDGKWYHCDATPHRNGGGKAIMTESEAIALEESRGSTYYDYDASLHPEVVWDE
jgi:hypothetical protein